MRIMFVCTGNICRSPLAHRLLEKQASDRGVADRIEVESSGTDHWHVGEEVDSRMRSTAAAHGLKLNHRARQIEPEDLREYDLVIAMGAGHLRAVRSLAHRAGVSNAPEPRLFREFDPLVAGTRKIPDVPDPYYGGDSGFEEVYRIVERTCASLLDALQEGRLQADEPGSS
ncbi:MAG: low molecular weight phosphotyrosine protein phosphatase [Spirochaetaceae bacterium]|nr:MAG: low molecular weight phosphotyrosine protein phosphatase [Spirochaetaceae bacterium]